MLQLRNSILRLVVAQPTRVHIIAVIRRHQHQQYQLLHTRNTVSEAKNETSKKENEIWIKRKPLPKTTSIKYTIPSDPYLLASKFQKLEKEGKLNDAVALIMQSKTRNQSQVLWNLVIDAYAKKGGLSRALRAYTEMRKRGFKPTQTTFTALIRACALSEGEKCVPMAEQVYKSMRDYGIEPSIIHINSLLAVYQRKHSVQAMLNVYNQLPRDGPKAPSLATYTILMSVLRREIHNRLEELKNEPVKPGSEDTELKKRVDRRTAHIIKNIRDTFDTLFLAWHSYTEDAMRRLEEPRNDTEPLLIDAHVVNIMLKTCHSVYATNRALGRRGLRAAEQIYGLERNLKAEKIDSENADADPNALPLAARLRPIAPTENSEPAQPIQSKRINIIDNVTIGLVLDLCERDKEYTKAIRFWRSLETHFAKEIEPYKSVYTEKIGKLKSYLK
ncbi:hypothetical protein GGI25_003478 [Coemansia spiralis]|uniref:Pentacotripeptide-repeat region of PRORP domain-containing protein n=2 Tax=Coemansia TaxID=4863 RepID=A0A9W8G6C3_9FUNG|nr:hypothetical protein EDC05_003419 [Coemansia umbellata]KAJ2621551.1 hypothetical protein GGI26_004014 [Coemansia sp. RSA 1358]KAJ2676726.1 hypothetical protein GGI25_003478 [Coemansia spiralis]